MTTSNGMHNGKRMSIRPPGGLNTTLGERSVDQSTLMPHDTSIRSDAGLLYDQNSMMADPSILPGQIDMKMTVNTNRRATVRMENPMGVNIQMQVPSGNMERRGTRGLQFDPNPMQINQPPPENPMNRRMSRAVQMDNQGGEPLLHGAQQLANGMARRMTTTVNQMNLNMPMDQGLPIGNPIAMGRRMTRTVDPGMVQEIQGPMPMGRPSMMMMPTVDAIQEPPRRKTIRAEKDQRLPTSLEHCREPTKFHCTNCNYTGLSKVEYEIGCYSYVTICVTFACCTPFVYCACMLTKWKDAHHSCPDCQRVINKVEPPDGTLPIVCCWDICELCAGDGEK